MLFVNNINGNLVLYNAINLLLILLSVYYIYNITINYCKFSLTAFSLYVSYHV